MVGINIHTPTRSEVSLSLGKWANAKSRFAVFVGSKMLEVKIRGVIIYLYYQVLRLICSQSLTFGHVSKTRGSHERDRP